MRLYLLFIVLLSLHLAGCDEPTYQRSREEIDRENAENFACKLEKPLTKGELYERAMQDYWNNQITMLWDIDKAFYEEKKSYTGSYTPKDMGTKVCGLTWTWLGKPKSIEKNTCYPLKVTKYHKFKELFFGAEKTFEKFMENRVEQVYRPEIDSPLYTADFYNKDNKFSVVLFNPFSYRVFPRDCCKLTTYQEILDLEEQHKNFSSNEVFITRSKNKRMSKEELRNYYFLVIKYLLWNSQSEKGYDEGYEYYQISHCGKIYR